MLEVFRNKSSSFVHSSFPGIHHTPETEELAIQLQTYIDIKESSFRDLAAVFLLSTMEDLIIEERSLNWSFGSSMCTLLVLITKPWFYPR